MKGPEYVCPIQPGIAEGASPSSFSNRCSLGISQSMLEELASDLQNGHDEDLNTTKPHTGL